MKRLAIAALALSALLPAGTATGQQPQSFVRLGAAQVDQVCALDYATTVLVPPRPWQPGDPVVTASVRLPDNCKDPRFQPLVVNRARKVTVSLGPAVQMGAVWFSGGRSTTLTGSPVGPLPATTWSVRVPLGSGKLVLLRWSPPGPSIEGGARGGVVQYRTDYKVTIRRRAGVVTAG
jgi:hypothetical protein